jgi:ABC-type nitrate/sulfonate/bicarbonate transport system substrate-binding protein
VLRNGLATGQHQLVVAGVDNAVAMAEAGHDIGILIGGDSAFNSFFVKPDIRDWAGLRGKTLIVDAPNTAYAVAGYRMLEMNGLPRGSYTVKPTGRHLRPLRAHAARPRSPRLHAQPTFSLQAEDNGLRKLADLTDVLGPYLGNAGWAMRDWSRANAETVQRYLSAYVESIRWMLNPANTEAATGLLAERLRLDPRHGTTQPRPPHRAWHRLRPRRPLRPRRLPQRAAHPRRSPRQLGRHPTPAGALPRPQLLGARGGGRCRGDGAGREGRCHSRTLPLPGA